MDKGFSQPKKQFWGLFPPTFLQLGCLNHVSLAEEGDKGELRGGHP